MAEALVNAYKDQKPMMKDSQIFIYHTGKSEIFKREGKNPFPTKKLLISFDLPPRVDVPIKEIEGLCKVFGTLLEVR